ncbi:MAG TPA: ROK family transcriptional regulator [Blastocatellia bacterium]|nr:ROK family transcriptional regulator [Blastocatellia bacterium]
MRKLDFDRLHTASKDRMRDINEAIVLNLIREHQPISRIQITRTTGLKISTVTVITRRLMEKGLIVEQGVAPSNGGRKARLLGLRPEKVCVVGVDIGVTRTTLALGDFNGEVIHQQVIPTGRRPLPFIEKLIQHVERLIASQKDHVEFEGIGISATGIVDSAGGRVIFSPNLGWQDVAIGAMFEQRLTLPVTVDNDARASALAEIWHGRGRAAGSMHLVFVTVNEGVGTGIVVNGQLFRGSSEGAGEFGHLSLNHNGPVCNCGNRGCWELYASDRATINRFLELQRKAGAADGKGDAAYTMRDVVKLAKGGDRAARASLITTAKYLALGIANIVNSLNPEMVVVGGDLATVWPMIEPIVLDTLKPKVFGRNFSAVRIVPSALEFNASLVGAFLHALSPRLSVGKVA